MRRRLWFVLALLLAPATAHAHDHIADFFGGYCQSDASSLPGFQISAAKTLASQPRLSLLADFNFNDGEHDDVDIKRFLYLVGARYTFAKENSRFAPSVHFLTGTVFDNAGTQEGSKPAVTLGGSFDVVPTRDASGWGVRFQAEYVVNGGKNYRKYSAGLVYRIHAR